MEQIVTVSRHSLRTKIVTTTKHVPPNHELYSEHEREKRQKKTKRQDKVRSVACLLHHIGHGSCSCDVFHCVTMGCFTLLPRFIDARPLKAYAAGHWVYWSKPGQRSLRLFSSHYHNSSLLFIQHYPSTSMLTFALLKRIHNCKRKTNDWTVYCSYFIN